MCSQVVHEVNIEEAPGAANLRAWDCPRRGTLLERDRVQAKEGCGLGKGEGLHGHRGISSHSQESHPTFTTSGGGLMPLASLQPPS